MADMSSSFLPLLVTMGDPAGIGPEVLAKYLAGIQMDSLERPLLLVGSQAALARGAALAEVNLPPLQSLPLPTDAALEAPVALALEPGI